MLGIYIFAVESLRLLVGQRHYFACPVCKSFEHLHILSDIYFPHFPFPDSTPNPRRDTIIFIEAKRRADWTEMKFSVTSVAEKYAPSVAKNDFKLGNLIQMFNTFV
jgi:hypothetical protein